MKKIFTFAVAAGMLTLASCGDGGAQAKKDSMMKDSLKKDSEMKANHVKDSIMKDSTDKANAKAAADAEMAKKMADSLHNDSVAKKLIKKK